MFFFGTVIAMATTNPVEKILWQGGLIYPPLKLPRLKAQYRQQESQNLIEP